VPCALAAAVLVLGQATQPAAAAVGARTESLAEARADAEALRIELADLRRKSAESILRLEAAESALAEAVTTSLQLGRQVDRARAAADGSDGRLARRVSALYRSGGSVGLWVTVMQARDPQDLVSRKANLDKVVASDAQLRDVAQAGSGELQALEAKAKEHAEATIAATAVAEDETARLNALMARQSEALATASDRVIVLVEEQRRAAAAEAARVLAAQQAEAARVLAAQQAEAARQQAARIAAGASFTGLPPSRQGSAGVVPVAGAYVGPPAVCPVGAVHSFTDTWGAPRSGGRTHKGTDVFAPYGSPAFAVVDGVIDKVGDGGLGGITLWLRADSGDRYYYAHNAANVVRTGQRVRAGQVIAYVGTSGNAASTPAHIHFQAHPGGGASANPAPWLAAICTG
jgi:murein DD-endopeptidase MepM/ murein hydrolase activator NlpD